MSQGTTASQQLTETNDDIQTGHPHEFVHCACPSKSVLPNTSCYYKTWVTYMFGALVSYYNKHMGSSVSLSLQGVMWHFVCPHVPLRVICSCEKLHKKANQNTRPHFHQLKDARGQVIDIAFWKAFEKNRHSPPGSLRVHQHNKECCLQWTLNADNLVIKCKRPNHSVFFQLFPSCRQTLHWFRLI